MRSMSVKQPSSNTVRILVINPNTNPAVTERVKRVASMHGTPHLSIDVINPAQGPHSIQSDQDRFEAERHVLTLLRQFEPARYDAYVLACFDDMALAQAREFIKVPVIGTCEPAIRAAERVSSHFSVVTTFQQAVAGIEDTLQRYRAHGACSVRAAGVGVAEAAAEMQTTVSAIESAIEAAIRVDGAQAILLASGGLTGYGRLLADRVPVPLIDGVEAAIKRAIEQTRRYGE